MKTKKLFKKLTRFKFSSRLYFLLCLILGLFCGCGTTARNVARLELVQIATYEQQIDKKIKAEKKFYKQTAKNIEDRFSQLTPYALSSSMTNWSNQAADEIVGQPVKHVTDWDIIKFVDSAIVDYQANRVKWSEMNVQIKKELDANIAPLEIAKKQLKEVRKKIEKLQQEPTEANQIMELRAFIQGTQEAYEKLEKEEEANQ